MAPGGARHAPAADPSDRRERFVAWLATAVAVAYSLAPVVRKGARRLWWGLRHVPAGLAWLEERTVPALSRAGAGVAGGVGWLVDATARAVAHGARGVHPVLTAVEERVVPALGRAGHGVAVVCAWTVEATASVSRPAGRAVAGAVGAVVNAVALAAAAGGHAATSAWRVIDRWVGPHLPRIGAVATKTGLGAVAVVAVLAMVTHPTLRLAAMVVDLEEEDAPEGAGLPALDERSTVYAADDSTLAILHGEVDRRVVALDQIPEHVQQAVLAAEDQEFYDHGGYDADAIARAAISNLRAGEVVQGGSTITQQLAKQNYVGNEQVLTRKVNELVHAVALEESFGKDELLERYLNQVYFGAGSYGIAAAAEDFFGVPPEELTLEQAALLAGLIRSPTALDPRDFPDAAERRRNQVLAAMAEEGFLTTEEARKAQEHPLEVAPPRERPQREPHVVEAVKREFLADPTFGETRSERSQTLFAGGVHIYTTVDPRLQAAATEAVQAYLPQLEGPTAAVAVVEPVTGKVRSLYSGLDFSAEQFDLATQGRRQPGSAFKPFVLAAALQDGGSMWQSLRGDAQATFDGPNMPEPWEVRNYEGVGYGTVDAHSALVKSVNTAFADLSLDVGLDPVEEFAAKAGIDVDAALGPESSRGPAIALGGLTHGVTPLEMASAYGVFANEGIAVKPYLIERVVDADGNELFAREPSAQRVVDEDVNALMVSAMQDVVRRGTGTQARLRGWEALGKTGTTQEGADAWFVGAVPGLSAAVWVGHPDAQTPVPGLTGGSLPAPIWQAFMARALDGVEPVAFPDASPAPGGPGTYRGQDEPADDEDEQWHERSG